MTNPEKTYNIPLTLNELTVIGSGLEGVAYKYAAPIVKKIEIIVNQQMQIEEAGKLEPIPTVESSGE